MGNTINTWALTGYSIELIIHDSGIAISGWTKVKIMTVLLVALSYYPNKQNKTKKSSTFSDASEMIATGFPKMMKH